MNGYGWHMGGMWIWWIVAIAILVAVVWIAINYRRRGGSQSGDSPEQILKRRFAKGEIDREQYDRMLSDLRR